MIVVVHGKNVDQVRETLEQNRCVDDVYEVHGQPVADLVRIYTKLNQCAAELGVEPIGYTVKSATERATERATEEYTAYDRGDLCADLDRALGDLIERTMHRYMPQKTARHIRHNVVSELADKVIEYDKSGSNPAKA